MSRRNYRKRRATSRSSSRSKKQRTSSASSNRRPLRRKYKYRGRRRAQMTRISAPSLTTATTFFTGSSHKNAKAIAKTFRAGSANIWTTNGNGLIYNTTGRQAHGSYAFVTTSDLSSMMNFAGQLGGASAGNIKNTARIFVGNYRANLTMTNNGTAPCFSDVYIYVARRSTGFSPESIWIGGMKDETNQTVADYTLTVGVTPNQAVGIAQYWKLKKIEKICLQPGQCHQQVYKFPINRVISNYEVTSAWENDSFLAGISHAIIIVNRGIPEPNNVTTPTGATTSQNALYYTVAEHCNVKWINDNDTNWAFTGQVLPTTLQGPIYNQGSGQMAQATVA